MATSKQMKKLIEVYEDVETEPMQKILGSEILGIVRDRPDLIAQFVSVACGLAEIVMKPLLELVKIGITVSARERFAIADHFKKGSAGIYYVSETFHKWFDAKVEENVPAGTLTSHKLAQDSVDGPIKAKLGEGHEVFLSWVFEKIEAQADGREGELLVNGRANIFYYDGRVVLVGWIAGFGWYVGARGVSTPHAWIAGRRVFSRNSVLKPSDAPVAA